MQWLNFCWEMLQITGDGKYASEIEKTAYNALMAARAEDGLRWEYYVRTNGELTPRGDWACCWSSGMVALEDLPSYIYKVDGSTLFVNVICEGAFDGVVRGKAVRVEQVSDYARTGVAEYVIAGGLPVGAGNDGSMAGNDGSMAGNDGSANRHARPDRASPGTLTLAIHHPQWAASYAATINGTPVKTRIKNGYICIKRSWKAGDRLRIEFPYQIRTLEKAWEYRNAGKKEYNFSNWYNGFTRHYVTFSAGPLVFACDHADTFERPNSLVVSREDVAAASLEIAGRLPVVAGNDGSAAGTDADRHARLDRASPGNDSPLLQVGPIVLRPIAMMPPFQTSDTEYRTTWLQIE